MPVYRYIACDLRTNALQAELPLTNVMFSGALNKAGTLSGTLQLGLDGQTSPGVFRSMAADLLTATTQARTALYVERDGVLVWGGIIWKRGSYNANTATIKIDAEEFISYLARRRIQSTLAYAATDQLAIVQTLVNWVQTPIGGNIGITVGSEVSGAARDRTYYGYEAKPVLEAIAQLAAVQGGFDFAVDVGYVAGVPTKTLNLAYPARGRSATNTGHVFETGRNIEIYDYPEDATIMANRIIGQGSGQADAMLTSTAVRTDIIDQGYPLLDDVLSLKDVSVQATLDAAATLLVNNRALPITIPQVTVYSGADPQLGAWIVGDYAKFVFGADPDKPDARFPTRLEVIARIVGYTANPGDEGQELVTLTLN